MVQTTSLQEEAYQYLKQQIKSGAFERNKIYSLKAVTGMLQMSKTPVRDALQKLSQEELIEILPSRGFRLQQPSDKEIVELYQLRYAIEGYCCYCLALQCQADPNCDAIQKLKVSLDRQEKIIAAESNSSVFLSEDQNFHNIIIDSVHNQRFESIMETYRDRIHDFMLASLEAKGILETTLREHKAVFEAICARDPIASQRAMLVHLDTSLRSNLNCHGLL